MRPREGVYRGETPVDNVSPHSGTAVPFSLRPIVCVLGAFSAILSSVEAEERPNIIVIFTDDHGYADLSCQEILDDVRTPHIDALAAGGVRMKSGYVTAPQCVPSRAGLLTGRYQNRFGVESNRKPLDGFRAERTVAERLKAAGYATGMVGKWHLGRPQEIVEHGFDDVFYQGGSWTNFDLDGASVEPGTRVNGPYHLDAKSAAARAFIARHHDEPFFLYVAYRAPHVPLDAPKKYLDRFPGEMPERRRQALAMLSAVDDGVGGIVASIRKFGVEERTLIFFIGDNGAPLKIHRVDAPGGGPGWDGSRNDPLNGEKGMLSEGGIRVPFVVSWKGQIPPGQIYDHPVISLDVAATAIAQAGLPRDPALDGVDLVPFLDGTRSSAPHATIYWRWISQAAIREGRWKFLRAGAREYLFDLEADRGEKTNRAKAHPEIARRMRTKLEAWSSELKPPGLATAALASTWEQYFDHYLDGKPAPRPRPRPRSERARKFPRSRDAEIGGWIARNTIARLVDGALRTRARLGPGGRTPFVTRAGLDLPAAVTVRVRLRTAKGGAFALAWREQGQRDFPSGQRASVECEASDEFVTHSVSLAGEKKIIHLRLFLPVGGADIRTIEVLDPGGERLESWRFAEASVQVRDPRLELRVFAEDPEIVTPIGLTVDDRDRVFVIESHTHLRPPDYAGPEADRVKILVDRDRDGRADEVSVFARGLREAMNLSFSPEGVLYVVCAREVIALYDRDGDSVSDDRERILSLETTMRYPHNSLLSLAFSNDGWLYVGRGNVGGRRFSYRGTDGTSIDGYGDGGDVIRCRPDGTKLERFATGFWNPFDLTFDHTGRLLLVDNDPDARGPNRLLHVVQNGDYGYKSLYGGGGNHPFQGWDGSLPGTLPMIAGTGEAPSGVLNGRRAALPPDLADDVLVTIWNEYTIERFETKTSGASIAAQSSILVSGGTDFRPVALDADRRGDVFISDWVNVDYPNHGRGRVWRLSVKDGEERSRPRAPYSPYEVDPGIEKLEALRELADGRGERLVAALASDDPFERQAAGVALARPEFRAIRTAALRDSSARVRLGALLAARRSVAEDRTDALKDALRDPDVDVRRAALMWAGEETRADLRGELASAIARPDVTPDLFACYLAAVESLDPEFVAAYRSQSTDSAMSLERRLDPNLVEDLVRDVDRSDAVRALAIRHLGNESRDFTVLFELATVAPPAVRLSAIEKLRWVANENAKDLLLLVAEDEQSPTDLRVAAISSLSWHPPLDSTSMLPLADSRDPAIALAVVRALASSADVDSVRAALRGFRSRESQADGGRIAELIDLVLGEPRGASRRPSTVEEWNGVLAEGGSPEIGRRVFHSPQASCARCHSTDGTRDQLGPSLENLGRTMRRERMIQSILEPSREFAPQYMAWTVVTVDGRVASGVQLDHKAGGAIEMFTVDGKTVRFEADEILRYEVSRRSLMPDDLESTLTVSDLRDLVAYLESLR